MRKSRGNGHPVDAANDVSDASPFAANAEWVRSVVEGQANLCAALCSLTARRLRAQADLFEGLATGKTPPDLLDRHARLYWSSWQDCADQAEQLGKTWLEPLRSGPASRPAAERRIAA